MERTAATGCVSKEDSVRNKPFAVLLFGVLVAVLLCTVPALAQNETALPPPPPDYVAGLKGEYFDNLDFTNLKLTRTDPTVNFDWGSGSPEPSIGPETFSVRWTGQVKANYSETYTFYATGDDYVRLYVNGQLVAEKWATGLGTATGTIALQAGQWNDIKMEYGASLNNAAAKLEYSSTSEPRKVIPQTQLRSSSLGEPPPPPDSAFKLEAETMSRPAGASVVSQSDASDAQALRFTQAGNATASVTLDQAADRIVVVAKAPQGGSPDLELKVNGVDQLGNGVPVTSTAYADYPVNKALGAGTYNITIRTDAGISPSTPLDVDVGRFEDAGAPPPPPPGGSSGTVTGELKKWHPVTVSFTGPSSSETASSPNPFLHYRLQVAFTSPSGKVIDVPGFYDGDGQGGSSGNVWKVRFNPDEAGTWSYKASFRQGANVAIDTSATAGAPTSFDGASGNFDIAARDASAPGFLSQGELEYVGEHYLKFRDGSYFLKGGADSPENWLGYAGFDNTPTARHTFSPHVQDWQSGDPVFDTSSADGGKGFIGALNYLSAQGVNSIYFLPLNIGGDGQDSSPYVSVANWAGSTANDNYHFDVSKLSQWDQAFAHAQKKGIMLHFVLNEAEAANKLELDGATLGPERKLFYREMVARFGYYNALQWNIAEEYDLNLNLGSDTVKSFADYIQSIDPYDHPITVHQSADPDTTWTPFLGDSRFSTTSFQYFNSYARYGAEVEEWRQKSSSAGRPLPIAMDELTPATTTNSADMRKGVLWPTYLSGGNLEWYIGSEDQSLEDFRRYAPLWQDTNRARTLVQGNLPFWQMQPADGLLSGESTNYGGGQVFAKSGDTYAIYLPNATSTGSLDLSAAPGSFEKKWFNPRSGSFEGTPQTVAGGTTLNLGAPPSTSSEDWVVLLKLTSSNPPPSGCPDGQYLAQYRNEVKTFATTPVIERCENAPINYNWGTGSPGPGVNADNFTSRWVGTFNFEASGYKFDVTTNDGMRVYVDGQILIDQWFDHLGSHAATKTMSAGSHEIKVEQYEGIESAQASVAWSKVAP